jgi:nucleoside triphosphate diphosphatase
MKAIDELLSIMESLRDPVKGCEWDRRQSIDSIAHYTLEEVYEALECIENNDMDGLCDELGDLLFHIVFYAQMAEEHDHFDFEQIVKNLSKKLRRRHPHVFDEAAGKDIASITSNWELIKKQERQDKALQSGRPAGLMDGISSASLALLHAEKLQKRAAGVGFDWSNLRDVFAKIDEEISELNDAIEASASSEKVAEEFGDLLFSCVNLARHIEVDSESALRAANRKFESRMTYIESHLSAQGMSIEEASLEQMEILWEKAKNTKR